MHQGTLQEHGRYGALPGQLDQCTELPVHEHLFHQKEEQQRQHAAISHNMSNRTCMHISTPIVATLRLNTQSQLSFDESQELRYVPRWLSESCCLQMPGVYPHDCKLQRLLYITTL